MVGNITTYGWYKVFWYDECSMRYLYANEFIASYLEFIQMQKWSIKFNRIN